MRHEQAHGCGVDHNLELDRQCGQGAGLRRRRVRVGEFVQDSAQIGEADRGRRY